MHLDSPTSGDLFKCHCTMTMQERSYLCNVTRSLRLCYMSVLYSMFELLELHSVLCVDITPISYSNYLLLWIKRRMGGALTTSLPLCAEWLQQNPRLSLLIRCAGGHFISVHAGLLVTWHPCNLIRCRFYLLWFRSCPWGRMRRSTRQCTESFVIFSASDITSWELPYKDAILCIKCY